MYITVHSAIGATAAQFLQEPWIAFILGFLLHFIFDMIPHGDEGIGKWKLFKTVRRRIVAAASLDLIGVIIITIYWLNHSDISLIPVMIAGIAGSIAPDALWGLYELTGTPLLKPYTKFHKKMHHILTKKELTIKQGLLFQGVILLILALIVS
jgi:hypothetical protein